ncbi:MAG TPA: hypothetical protein VF071_01155 [Candidatus Limnocylindria bacterium]
MKDRMRNLGASAGTAVLAVLMVGVVAFGANTIRPLTSGTDAEATPKAVASAKAEAAFGGGDEGSFKPPRDEQPEKTQQPKPEQTEKPEPQAEPTAKPVVPEPTAKPVSQPDPTAKPKPTDPPKPQPSVLELQAWAKGSYIKVAWSKYLADGFEYYKLVRSKDATVSWPLGGDDQLVAAIGDPYAPFFADKPVCGREFHYRVFAVRHGESGYVVLAASNVAGAAAECVEPPAEPKAIGLDAWVTDAGAVKLAWGACAKDGFWAYKVVRSQVNEWPTYPTKDGDQLIAAIGDASQTTFKDADVAPGQTWSYRVLALGEGGAVLCITPARTVTVE